MFDIGTNILALIFVLGVMIFVHEFGHFATAKFFGIRVEVFAFGFGPRLFGFQHGPTDYRVCLLPLGGYVKMKGENPDEELSGDPDEYLTRPKWQRFFVLAMGPAMNVALAFVLFTAVFTLGVDVETWTQEPAVIGTVAPDSPAERVGLQAGEQVVAIDGEAVENWRDLTIRTAISANVPMELTVEGTDGSRRQVELLPDAVGPSEQGYSGLFPSFPPMAGRIEIGSVADQAGIEPGDRFLEVEGQPVARFSDVQEIIRGRAGQPTRLVVGRDGERLEITATPEGREVDEAGTVYGYLGVEPGVETSLQQFGVVAAAGRALGEIGRQTTLVGEILSRIFTARMSVRTLSGPIEIARYSGGAARTGDPRVLMTFMAIVSLQLGLLNLLPIPVLDGGHIAVLAVEGLLRRDFSLQVKERLMQVGLVLLVALMAVVITFDVIKSLPANGLGWPF